MWHSSKDYANAYCEWLLHWASSTIGGYSKRHTCTTPSISLGRINSHTLIRSKNGTKMVETALMRIIKPNTVAPPYFDPSTPPSGDASIPYEEALRIKPSCRESQSKSACCKKNCKIKFHQKKRSSIGLAKTTGFSRRIYLPEKSATNCPPPSIYLSSS